MVVLAKEFGYVLIAGRSLRLRRTSLFNLFAHLIGLSALFASFPSIAYGDCKSLRDTTPQGIACFNCLHPRAEAQAKSIAEILKKSCLKKIAISYLVDGSFGDVSRLQMQIQNLQGEDREIFLHLYLLNGPSQRRYRSTPITGIGTQMSPIQFRKELKERGGIYMEVRQLLRRIFEPLKMISDSGVQLSIIPMLEDNLDDESFQAVAEIVQTEFKGLSYRIGRNPCSDCYPGNGRRLPSGFFLEVHTSDPNHVPLNGSVSNDGEDVSFDGHEGSQPLSTLKRVRDAARAKGTVFFLWNAEYQGLRVSGGKITGNEVSADKRPYPIPTEEEAEALTEFLKY